MITLGWALLAALASALLTLLVTRALASRAADEPAVTAPSDPEAQFDGAFVRLVRALPIGVILVDRSLRVEFANGSAGAIFGFDAGARRRRTSSKRFTASSLKAASTEALRGEASVAPFELPGRRGARTYRVSVYPLVERRRRAARRRVCRRSDRSRSAGSRAQRVSFKRFARAAHAAVVDQTDDRNGDRIAGRRSRRSVLAASAGASRPVDGAGAAASRPNPRRIGALKLNLRDIDLEEVAASDRQLVRTASLEQRRLPAAAARAAGARRSRRRPPRASVRQS